MVIDKTRTGLEGRVPARGRYDGCRKHRAWLRLIGIDRAIGSGAKPLEEQYHRVCTARRPYEATSDVSHEK